MDDEVISNVKFNVSIMMTSPTFPCRTVYFIEDIVQHLSEVHQDELYFISCILLPLGMIFGSLFINHRYMSSADLNLVGDTSYTDVFDLTIDKQPQLRAILKGNANGNTVRDEFLQLISNEFLKPLFTSLDKTKSVTNTIKDPNDSTYRHTLTTISTNDIQFYVLGYENDFGKKLMDLCNSFIDDPLYSVITGDETRAATFLSNFSYCMIDAWLSACYDFLSTVDSLKHLIVSRTICAALMFLNHRDAESRYTSTMKSHDLVYEDSKFRSIVESLYRQGDTSMLLDIKNRYDKQSLVPVSYDIGKLNTLSKNLQKDKDEHQDVTSREIFLAKVEMWIFACVFVGCLIFVLAMARLPMGVNIAFLAILIILFKILLLTESLSLMEKSP